MGRLKGDPPLSKCPEEGEWGAGDHFNVHSERTEII